MPLFSTKTHEIELLLQASEKLNLNSVGDAILIGLESGQRLGDILALPDKVFDDRIKLTQFKRGAMIDIPMSNVTKERIASIRLRKKRLPVASMEALILYENTGMPYDTYLFNKKFRMVRKFAAQSKPEILDKRFQDLRDTSVTRLAMSGCTIPEICSITGHSEKTAHTIMKHYLVRTKHMADNAMAKLEKWKKKNNIS